MPEAFDMIATQKRRQEILDLKMEGYTYRDIADIMLDRHGGKKLPSGFDASYAQMDVSRELDKLRNETWDKAKNVLMIEIRRLEEMQKSMWKDFQDAEKSREKRRIVNTFIKLQERKSSFLGLDQPEKVEMLMSSVENEDIEGFEWASPEDMPQHVENGSEVNSEEDA